MNPGLGGPGEGEIAAFVAEWARDAGLEVEVDEAAPGRPNVIATARGTGGGKTLLLNAHLDTVGFGAMADPLVPRVEDGAAVRARRLRHEGRARGVPGRGGGGGEARAARRRGRHRGRRRGAVVDRDADRRSKRVAADAAIVAEPTGMRVAIAHKGFVAFEIETHGRAAHGSRPDLGIDAIAKMGHVLVGLEALDRALRERPTHPLLGSGSLHAGVVAGGIGVLDLSRPLPTPGRAPDLPGESLVQVESELQGLLDRLAARRRRTSRGRGGWSRRAIRSRSIRTEEIVRLVDGARGRGRTRSGRSFWTDAA